MDVAIFDHCVNPFDPEQHLVPSFRRHLAVSVEHGSGYSVGPDVKDDISVGS